MTWKKIISLQFIFFVIVLMPALIMGLVGIYLSNHLIHDGILLFTYDNVLATTLAQWQDSWHASGFPMIIPTYANHIAYTIGGTPKQVSILGDIISIGFWILVLNIIFFSFIFIKKRISR